MAKLTHQPAEITNENHRTEIETEKAKLTTTLNDNSVIASFNQQKEKNERIVRECWELLGKLKGEELRNINI